MISLRSQSPGTKGLPVGAQIAKVRFAVRTASAHLLCLARLGGDQDIAIG
jgi:hypothetical protein